VLDSREKSASIETAPKYSTAHTIEWCLCSSNLIEPVSHILALPNRPDPVKLCVVEIENGIAWASEWIILEPTNGEVAGGVDERLGYIGRLLPAIGTFLEAVDCGASEEIFDVRYVSLVAPEEIDVAS
jgi:hypothetical protein